MYMLMGLALILSRTYGKLKIDRFYVFVKKKTGISHLYKNRYIQTQMKNICGYRVKQTYSGQKQAKWLQRLQPIQRLHLLVDLEVLLLPRALEACYKGCLDNSRLNIR